MKLQDYDSSGNNKALKPAYMTDADSAHSTDVEFFTSMLEGSAATRATAIKSEAPPLLADVTKSLGDSKIRIKRMLNSARNEIDVDKLRSFPLELGGRQLANHLLIKSLAKTTQCIEKISNLQ